MNNVHVGRCRVLFVFLLLVLAGCSNLQVTTSTPALQGDIEILPWPDSVQETSGLASRNGLHWTVNDSGNSPQMFALNAAGEVVKHVQVAGAKNIDWESLAHDSNSVYIADCGNNLGQRNAFQIYKVAWNALDHAGVAATVAATEMNIQLADYQPPQSRQHNFDCEAITVVDEELWLFTKNRGDGQTRLYRLDKHRLQQTVTVAAEYPVGGLITGADYDPVTGQLALLGYSRQRLLGYSFLWLVPVTGLPDWQQAQRLVLQVYAQWEAVQWLEDGRLLLSCEKSLLSGVSRGLMTPRLPDSGI
ncbi:hypothetical protein ACFVYJ_12120 [Pontibacter sp. JAM-7]|uniref:hypothetical protein n=1 Tax=Pontibacter sp. JAM-7 TaxID=3366581 RepID=UPI003AF490C4